VKVAASPAQPERPHGRGGAMGLKNEQKTALAHGCIHLFATQLIQ
jgi:hypothetical protein